MWVWKGSAFSTKEERQRLLTFCSVENISHIDLSIKTQTAGGDQSVKNQGTLKDFIKQSREQNITINALRGDPKMFFEKNQKRTLAELRTFTAFNRSLPLASRLNGIKYDVEPYLTEEWKAGGEQREVVIRDYLSCLKQIKVIIDQEAPDLMLSADVPFWWDKEEFTATFAGVTKRFVEHVQDLTDSIGIMSYRVDSAKVLKLIEHELAYATQIGKTISPGLETIDLKEKESRVSFHGTSPKHFRKTVRELQGVLTGNKAVRSIMLHHYDSLAPYLKSE